METELFIFVHGVGPLAYDIESIQGESLSGRVERIDAARKFINGVLLRAKYAAVWEMTRPQNSEDKRMAERAAKQLGVSTAEVRRMIGEFNKMRGNDGRH